MTIRISPDEVTPTLVKRIVGVDGDTLLMRHGQLTVNGAVVTSPNSFVLAGFRRRPAAGDFCVATSDRDPRLAIRPAGTGSQPP